MLLFLLHGCTQKYEALSEAKPSVHLDNSKTFSGQARSVFQVHGHCPGLGIGYSFFLLDKLHLGSKVKQTELCPNRTFLFFFASYLKIRDENTMKSLFIPDLLPQSWQYCSSCFVSIATVALNFASPGLSKYEVAIRKNRCRWLSASSHPKSF